MANPRYVSPATWKEAKHALMGFTFNIPSMLTTYEKNLVKNHLRGPFANGMSEQDAERMSRESLGWELSRPDRPNG